MQRTPSYPSSAAARKASWKAPGEGAAVSGSTGLALQRAQNSVGVSETPSMNSSSPKRIERGTMVTPCSAATAVERSHALSVTIRILAMGLLPVVGRAALGRSWCSGAVRVAGPLPGGVRRIGRR